MTHRRKAQPESVAAHRRDRPGRGRVGAGGRTEQSPLTPVFDEVTPAAHRGDHRPLPAVAVGAAAAAAPGAVGGGLRQPGRHRFCAEVLELTTAEVSAVATFYTMYKRTPCGEHLVSVCTNTLCAALGGDAIYATLSRTLGRRARGDRGRARHARVDHPGARRVPGGLRPGPGAAGQLRVLRQPDRRVGRRIWSTRCSAASGRTRPAAPPLTDFRTVELELAGIFPDLAGGGRRATRRPPETLRGAQLAAATRDWAAPAMPDEPPALPDLPEKK